MFEIGEVPAIAAPRGEPPVALLPGDGILVQSVVAHVITNFLQQLRQVSLGAGQRNLRARERGLFTTHANKKKWAGK